MISKLKNNDFSTVLKSPIAAVDFSASWCGPCKMLAPVIDELSEEISDVDFFTCDIDENNILASSFGISSVPTVILFKNGKAKAMTVGFKPKSELKNFIESNR